MSKAIEVNFEVTPNPNSLKFTVSQQISTLNRGFDDPLKAGISPLASKLFGFPWASEVYIGNDYITVSKQEWVDWDIIAQPLSELIKEHIQSGQVVLFSEDEEKQNAQDAEQEDYNKILENDPEVVKQIKAFINTQVQPMVQMDGGYILFSHFQEGSLYIKMQGACSGCPSSTITLKEGIEARIQEQIPEVKEVVSI